MAHVYAIEKEEWRKQGKRVGNMNIIERVAKLRDLVNLLLKESLPSAKELVKKLYETLNLKSEENVEDNSFLALEKFYSFVSDYSTLESTDLESLIYHLTTMDSLEIKIEI